MARIDDGIVEGVEDLDPIFNFFVKFAVIEVAGFRGSKGIKLLG